MMHSKVPRDSIIGSEPAFARLPWSLLEIYNRFVACFQKDDGLHTIEDEALKKLAMQVRQRESNLNVAIYRTFLRMLSKRAV